MRNIIGVLLVSLFFTMKLDAAPYVIGEYKYIQPNGFAFSVQLNGDEYGVYECSDNGLVTKNEQDGYYYYAIFSEKREMIPSNIRIGVDELSLKSELKSIKIKNYDNWKNFNRFGKQTHIASKIAAGPNVPDSLIVLLVQFSDIKHRGGYTKTHFNNSFFLEGYTSPTYYTPDSETVYGSVCDYFKDMSAAKTGGSWVLKGRIANIDSAGTNTPKWITMPNTKAYYDTTSEQGILSSAGFIDSIRTYAYNQDGISVDLSTGSKKLAIIYSGNMWYTNGTNRSCLHSQALDSYGAFINSEVFGSPYNNESSNNKFQHIGVNCHEFAHILGEVHDYRDPDTFKVNIWELMGSGAQNGIYKTGDCPAPLGPFHRNMLGWMSFTNVTTKLENEAITYNSNYNITDVYKIIGKTAPTTEYFLIENRRTYTGGTWDKGLNEPGLLIWRIHDWGSSQYDMSLVPADSSSGTSGGDLAGDAFRSPNRTWITDSSPVSRVTLPSGDYSSIQITGIPASSTSMSINISPYRFGTLPSNETWTKKIYIGDDLSVPDDSTLTVSADSVFVADGKKIEVSGKLIITGNTVFTKTSGGTYWSGIDVESGGSMIVNGDITIEYASCGIDFYGGTMTNGTNTVTIQNCSTVGFSVDGYTGTFQNIHCKNCGNYGGILKSGTSGNPVIRYCTVETSAHGTYNSGDVVVEYCDLKANNTGDNVRLAYASTVDLNGYNKIGHPQGYYAVDDRTDSYVDARNNWWGVNPPLSTFFTFPSSSYIDYSSAQPNDSFSAGVYKPVIMENRLEAAQRIEFSGDFSGAIAAYTELLQAEKRTGWKKFLITSMLRAHDQSDRNYRGLKTIINNELNDASGYYQAALKFILCDILVREGNYQKAIEGFLLNAEQYKGTSIEVEMLAQVARIYGMNLNDTAHAREYAVKAANLNPGQPALRSAFAAAGQEFSPSLALDRFQGVIENFNAPDEPQKPDSESTSEFITVSPNPANPITTITYSIKNQSNVRLSIYSVNGQKIATLANGPMSAGRHSVSFDGSNYASGVYFYRFESAVMKKSGKILLLK